MNSDWDNHVQECKQFDCNCKTMTKYIEKYYLYEEVLEDKLIAEKKGVPEALFKKIVKNAEWELSRPKTQLKNLIDSEEINTVKGKVTLKSIHIACGENIVSEEQIKIVLEIMSNRLNE